MEVKEEVDLFIKSVNVRDLSELSGSLSLLTSARAGKSGSMTVHLPSPTFLLETPHYLPQIPSTISPLHSGNMELQQGISLQGT